MFPTIIAVKPTKFVASFVNGMIPVNQLTKIGPSGYLDPTAARSWFALLDECLKNGIPLTYTYGGTNRPYGDQVRVFEQRMESCTYAEYLLALTVKRARQWADTDPNKPTRHRGKRWWRRRRLPNGGYPAGVATPGTSNHGWARAIDVAFDNDLRDGIGPDDATSITSHPKWALFQKLVLKYGFSWEDKSEPWHIRYVAGDVIPAATIEYERRTKNAGVPVPTPVPARPTAPAVTSPGHPAPTTTEKIVNSLPVVKRGSTGFHAKLVQGCLNVHGQSCAEDGNFGPASEAQLKWFQGGHSLPITGVADAKTWAALLGV